ncbi:hypothetical protein P167DRAFT_358297 [Morchella conica CCBAS932]|uniref:Uncharacterized protein n=1 Tax=Morchella conica CCBAS932 TaxID=1392247 RepID=A0A3N4KCR9_9PEZI|nr:hypothetical protein P167DRAFT_358297 [Morchella conica CCBAS932]
MYRRRWRRSTHERGKSKFRFQVLNFVILSVPHLPYVQYRRRLQAYFSSLFAVSPFTVKLPKKKRKKPSGRDWPLEQSKTSGIISDDKPTRFGRHGHSSSPGAVRTWKGFDSPTAACPQPWPLQESSQHNKPQITTPNPPKEVGFGPLCLLGCLLQAAVAAVAVAVVAHNCA